MKFLIYRPSVRFKTILRIYFSKYLSPLPIHPMTDGANSPRNFISFNFPCGMKRKQNMWSHILNDLLNKHYTLLTKLKTSTTEATLGWKYKITVMTLYSCDSTRLGVPSIAGRLLKVIETWFELTDPYSIALHIGFEFTAIEFCETLTKFWNMKQRHLL